MVRLLHDRALGSRLSCALDLPWIWLFQLARSSSRRRLGFADLALVAMVAGRIAELVAIAAAFAVAAGASAVAAGASAAAFAEESEVVGGCSQWGGDCG